MSRVLITILEKYQDLLLLLQYLKFIVVGSTLELHEYASTLSLNEKEEIACIH